MENKMMNALTEREEKLLERHFDGEVAWYENYFVQRLLARKEAARQYVASLASLHANVQGSRHEASALKVDLWERVSKRIDAEERAALFLGKRTLQPVRVASQHRFAWGAASSAALAAAIAFVMITKQPGTEDSASSTIASRGALSLETRGSPIITQEDGAVVDFVSQGGMPRRSVPRIVESELGGSMDVDWMKSDGQLRVLHDAENRSAVIWVQRKRPSVLSMRSDKGLELRSRGGRQRASRSVVLQRQEPDALPVIDNGPVQ